MLRVPTQNLLAASRRRPQVRVWDVSTHKCLATLVGHNGAVRALAASDNIVFSGSDDTTIRVGGPGGSKLRRRLWTAESSSRQAGTGCCAAPQQACHLSRCLLPHTPRPAPPAALVLAQAWDATSLTCLRTLEGHEDNVRVLAVGHDCLFSGSWDKTVRVCGRCFLLLYRCLGCVPHASALCMLAQLPGCNRQRLLAPSPS